MDIENALAITIRDLWKSTDFQDLRITPQKKFKKIRDAVAYVNNIARKILDDPDTAKSNQLAYDSIFGRPMIAEALYQDLRLRSHS